MKLNQSFVLTLIVSIFACSMMSACSSVKTRKEAAEDAKAKSLMAEKNPPPGPIEEDDESAPSGASGAADEKFLNDELAAMGIDPSNPDGRKNENTPEPETDRDDPLSQSEVHGNPVPMPEPRKKIAAKKPVTKKAAQKKKPAKKTKKRPVTE